MAVWIQGGRWNYEVKTCEYSKPDCEGVTHYTPCQNRGGLGLWTKYRLKVHLSSRLFDPVIGFNGGLQQATESQLNYPRGMAIDRNGDLYVVDRSNDRVRKVFSVLERSLASSNNTFIVSQRFQETYVFDPYGNHIQTTDLNTGSTLQVFAYDIDGALSTMTDRFGNVTQILNSGGLPYAIVAPDGQTTYLNMVNGQLESVDYPDGSGYSFTYSLDGLFTGKLDPNGGQYVYDYDTSGRVIQTQDAVNGISRFSSSSANNTAYSTSIDQEGRVKSSTRTTSNQKDGSRRGLTWLTS